MRMMVITPDMRQTTGVGNASRLLVSSLRKTGSSVDVVTSETPYGEDCLLKIKVGSQKFPLYNAADGLTFRGKRIYREISTNIEIERYDLVFCVAWQTWAVDIIRYLPNTLQKKCFIVSHGTYFINHTGKMKTIKSLRWLEYKKSLLPNLLDKVAGLIVLDIEGSGDRFYDLDVAKRNGINVFELPNAVESMEPDEYKEKIYNEKLNLISISGFNSLKDPLFLINTMPPNLDAKLKIFGACKNKYYHDCIKRINDRELSHKIELVVGATGDQIRNEMKNAHINVVSSTTECQPLSVIEGMACGVPFISRPIPSLENIEGGIVTVDDLFWTTVNEVFKSETKYSALQKKALHEFEQKFSYSNYIKKLKNIIHYFFIEEKKK